MGCANTCVDWTVYFAAVHLLPFNSLPFYAAVKGFSYFCGAVNSFLLNRCWTFQICPRGNERERFIRFAAVNVAGLGLNSFSLYAFLRMGVPQAFALSMAASVAFCFNFTLNKLWVFREN